MTFLSKKLQNVKPSTTFALAAKARKLREEGHDIIALGVGEPDFDTPNNIKEAAINAIKTGHTKYTPINGIPKLKEAICAKLLRDNKLEYAPENIIVSTGAKQVIYNLLSATLNPEDEVIIPAPYWASYPDMVSLAGGKSVIVHTNIESHLKITAQQLENAITKNTKWLMINSPNNPSGMIYSEEELQSIANILRKNKNVYVMSDDIYEHTIFDNQKFFNLASIAPDLKERIVIVNGVSKTYSMTGWRIGYAACEKNIIDAMSTIQSQSTSCASSISQIAAIEALNGIQEYVVYNNKQFENKRDLAIELLGQIDCINFIKPQGTFYLFLDCNELINNYGNKVNIKDDNDLVEFLLTNASVSLLPGGCFGMKNYIRLSYATSQKNIEIACKRIINTIENSIINQ